MEKIEWTTGRRTSFCPLEGNGSPCIYLLGVLGPEKLFLKSLLEQKTAMEYLVWSLIREET